MYIITFKLLKILCPVSQSAGGTSKISITPTWRCMARQSANSTYKWRTTWRASEICTLPYLAPSKITCLKTKSRDAPVESSFEWDYNKVNRFIGKWFSHLVVLHAPREKSSKLILKKLVVPNIRSSLRTRLNQNRKYEITISETIGVRFISSVACCSERVETSVVGEIWVESHITYSFFKRRN